MRVLSRSLSIRHVVLDRDGVLNRERTDGWIVEPGDWVWEEGSLAALTLLARSGRRVSLVTNQSCIGRALVSRSAVDALHDWLRRQTAAAGASLDAILVCPHAPEDGCECRKPRPGLVVRAIEHSGIPAHQTLLIGDDLRDLEAGRAAGTHVALVCTGKGRHWKDRVDRDTLVFDNLLAAADWLISRQSVGGRVTDHGPER